MTATPLRDAVAAAIRHDAPHLRLDQVDDSTDVVLAIVADHIEASVHTSTDARKRTILTGLADRIARGAL